MIYRTKKGKGNFVQFSKEILVDDTISIKSKLVLIYMLGFPDDWKFNKTKIKRDLKIGNQSLENILLELRNTGYLVMKRTQSTDGWSWEYLVYEEKLAFPIPLKPTHGESMHGEPVNGNPMHGNIPPSSNNEFTNNNLTNNKSTDNNPNYKDIYNLQANACDSKTLPFDVLSTYFSLYKGKFNKEHPILKNEVELLATIKFYSISEKLSLYDWKVMIMYYLYKSKFAIKVDYNINHFLSDGILFALNNDLENIHTVLDDELFS